MGILFRPAHLADAPGLVPLVEELGYPAPGAQIAARLARLLAAQDQLVVVAEEERALLGWIHAQEFLSLASDPAALVTGLVVDPAARRRGIGRGLVAAVEAWARARGLVSLRLRTRVARRDAQAFYLSLGFELAKRQLQFRKEL
ncbi:MAG TPA: GNAT family N-acetyltransferase [Planctomycetota bacterium]